MSHIFGAEVIRIEGFYGLVYTLEDAERELERLQEKADELRRQIDYPGHNNTMKRRLRKRLDRTEAESDKLHSALHPPYLDGIGYASDTFNPGTIVPCRASNCDNRLTRKLAHQLGLGFCPPCHEKATTPTYERTDA